MKGDIWWFLYIIDIIDIMDQKVKGREGLSHLPCITNEGREIETKRKKKNSSVFGIKFQPKETENVLENSASSQNTDQEPPSVGLNSASRGGAPLGAYEDPSKKHLCF